MTLFDRIIAGQIPASFAYQDAVCVAFMDINPLSRGHVLVVPRQSVATMEELDSKTLGHLWETAARIGRAQRRSLGSAAQHFLVNDGKDASQSVPHVHIHVIPRYRGDRYGTVARMIWHLSTLGGLPRERPLVRRRIEEEARAIAEALRD